MVNKNKFEFFCKEKNISYEELCSYVGISISTLYRKLNHETDFYRNEILLITQKLKLSNDEMIDIFFN